MLAATIVDTEWFLWLAAIVLVIVGVRNLVDLFRGR